MRETTDPIALFLPSLHGGGAERAMLTFSGELIRQGRKVDLVVGQLEGRLREIIPKGVRVFNLKSKRTALALPKLVRYLRERQPLALYSTIINGNVVASCAARIAGVSTPIIVRESNSTLSSPKSTPRHWVTFLLSRYAYRLSDGVIAVSRGVADQLRLHSPLVASKIEVIPTPIVSEEVLAASQEPVDHEWFLKHDKPILVSAGRLEKHKGFSTLLSAFARLRGRVDARLVILGEGSKRRELEAQAAALGIAEHIALLGFKHNPFAYMSKADAFVLASEYEGLPNVLVQAMAFGVPIVSTDCPSGPSEILCDGRFGDLVPVGDEAAIATALVRALNKPRQREAQEHARSAYGAPKAALDYLAVAGIR